MGPPHHKTRSAAGSSVDGGIRDFTGLQLVSCCSGQRCNTIIEAMIHSDNTSCISCILEGLCDRLKAVIGATKLDGATFAQKHPQPGTQHLTAVHTLMYSCTRPLMDS